VRLHTFPSGLGLSVLLVPVGLLLAALPPAEYFGAVAAAVVGAAIAAFGVGYPIAKKRKSDADIAAYQAREQAEKGTTLRALADAQEQIRKAQELLAERDRLAAEKDRHAAERERQMQAIITEKDKLIDTLMRDLGEERDESHRVRKGAQEFLVDLLENKGVVKEDEAAAP
jgi:hypothetical protein